MSPIGVIVEEEWRKTKHIRGSVELDAYVVMPNHIHGIIVIKKSFVETTGPVVSYPSETTHRVVSTRNKTKTLKPNSLGSIVGQFKSVCTKRIRATGFDDFTWQPGYYDHVVRDEHDLQRIREYIRLNPERWDVNDEFAHNIAMDPIHAR
jgi:putative transposase